MNNFIRTRGLFLLKI